MFPLYTGTVHLHSLPLLTQPVYLGLTPTASTQQMKKFFRNYFERFFWVLALAALFFMDADNEGFSFCLFKLAGFGSCPGCGLGHSIHHTLHLDFSQAFAENKMGVPVTVLLITKAAGPVFYNKNKTTNGYQTTVRIAAGDTN